MAKVIGIVGSPHKNGNTETLMKEALRAISEEGVETELIPLHDKKVGPCQGHGSDVCENGCVQKDDMMEIYRRVKEADGLIIGSPVYLGITAQTVVVMGRLVHLRRKGVMKNKIGGAMATGDVRNGGEEGVINDIVRWMQVMDMIIASSEGSDAAHFGATAVGNPQKDEEGLKSARILGKRVVELIKLRGGK